MDHSLKSRYRVLLLQKTLFLSGLLAVCLVSLFIDVITGPSDLSFQKALVGLIDPDSLTVTERLILWDIRLPDALIALIIGGMLGLAGLETQTGLNNPLASPFTLGVSSAAVLGASIAIVLFEGASLISSNFAVPTFALIFALCASGLIVFFAAMMGGERSGIILFGIALMFLCNAVTSALQYFATSEAVQQIVFWTIGNLTKVGWDEVVIVSLVFLIVLPFSFRQVWVMTLLRSGEMQASSAGVDVGRLRIFLILRVSLLTAFAVCFVGTIGFIGLVGPHIARLILGEDHRFLMPGACLCGAVILSISSILTKAIIPGIIIPVGIITSFIGVPILMVLILKRGARL